MATCLFCRSNGPFSTTEHVIPESLGNDDLLLRDEVCDGCQRYFGKEIEQYVLEKTPIAAWRVLLGTLTKKGKRPRVDLSQPRSQRGVLPRVSAHHDDVAFVCRDDESVEITKLPIEMARQIEQGERSRFQFVFTLLLLYMMGRFLCKVGLELVCSADPVAAREARFATARAYAREGPWNPLWPILWYESGCLNDLKQWRRDDQGLLVESQCYSYWLGEVDRHCIFEFGIGTDRFVVALDEPLCLLLLETQKRNPECNQYISRDAA